MQEPQYCLSIIIPAYNEEKRLHETLTQITEFIERQDYTTEVVVVDNASTDRTGDIISSFSSNCSFLRYVFEPVRGKGAAVKSGVMASHGEFLIITDADLSVPIEEANKFLAVLHSNSDIAIASRELPGANRYNEPPYRHFIGRAFNLLIRSLLLPDIHDTQCGFKGFRHSIANDLFSSNTLNGWSFDAEILYIALSRGYRIAEVPVDWYYREFSRVNIMSDPWYMLKDILTTYYNTKRGKYNK